MQAMKSEQQPKRQTKQILSRLDRLPFSGWHMFMVLSLGLVWIFDGYEVSLLSLFRKYIVKQHSQEVFKSLATAYQIGCIFGSMIFGISAFIIGRKKIFIITLIIYAIGIVLSLVSQSVYLFIFARFLTGISVGGQFTAIFTAIDEFLPPKYRGRVNIGIDGTWHFGASLAAILNMIIGQTQNWRYLFVVGLFGIFSLLMMRKNIPQSPRWLVLKQQYTQADLVIKKIQYAVQNKHILLQPSKHFIKGQFNNIQNQLVSQRSQMEAQNQKSNFTEKPKIAKQKSLRTILFQIFGVILLTSKKYKKRFFLALFLMFSQAFFFNLIYYKFPATLQNTYHLSQSQIAFYMLPLSLSSFFSTLIVGPLFDKFGRKLLLLITYGFSGTLLILSQFIKDLFWLEIFICVMFFFTSPAGSSANLIASEIFPTSSRTLILFVMFIAGMFGGIGGVWSDTVYFGSILMILAGILGYFLCPASQNKSLQQIQQM